MAELFSDIINRCKQGDRKAQEAVYNLLAAKMFAVCMRYCQSRAEAEDVLHDGFVTIFTKIKQFNHAGSFEGWVRRIFVNHALERCRNDNRLPVIENIEAVEYQLAEEDAADVADDWAAYQLSEADLLDLINQLPQQYRIVFNMYVLEGLSHREISDKLSVSEGTSRSNLQRARVILQKQVNELAASIKYKQYAKK
ncbi:MAG: RNA polymerase sigma factor [Bacteroidales bacterium]|nr:RNA polymerase sigma factor [Bacteroidales bacterium]